jgi:hypothetical protein
MNDFNKISNLVIKSGSKEKSINSYIKRISEILQNSENIELKANGKINIHLGK